MSFFESVVRDHSKDHAVAASMSITTTNLTTALHHYQGLNLHEIVRLLLTRVRSGASAVSFQKDCA